jgi:Cu+-exporting ATPase
MLTGEPMPVAKGFGDSVIGGTINGTGTLTMDVKRVGADTLLARIVQMVAEAQRSRAPVQQLADQVASYFVPGVVSISILTFVLWSLWGPAPAMAYALVNAVAVLIIACPCALGLATPMSIMVAMGRGAHAGVLFKNAQAIELLQNIDILVVDKTGTLTEGRPTVVSISPVRTITESELLMLAASVEHVSEHPLSEAIVRAAADRALELHDVASFSSTTGLGVSGVVQGISVAIGSESFMKDLGVKIEPLGAQADALHRNGQSVVYISKDLEPAGLIGVTDPVKSTTAEAIRALKKDGLEVVMLTGDHVKSAEAVARQLDIKRVMAGALPHQKAELVKQLQSEGHRVAMAGDGINDAPALAQADVGIAMGTGTDVAIETADVALIRGDLRSIMSARMLSRATMRNIRQNLFFAFIYNSLGVPVAAGLLYPIIGVLMSPMLAAVAMSFSSVSVITNALRLKRARLN